MASRFVRAKVHLQNNRKRVVSAFFLEDANQIAKRHDAKFVEGAFIDVDRVDQNLKFQSELQTKLLISYDVYVEHLSKEQIYLANSFLLIAPGKLFPFFFLYFDLAISDLKSNIFRMETNGFSVFRERPNRKKACMEASYVIQNMEDNEFPAFQLLPDKDFKKIYLNKVEQFGLGIEEFNLTYCVENSQNWSKRLRQKLSSILAKWVY